MLSARVEKIIQAIKRLEVQGAERVAYAGALAAYYAAHDCPESEFAECFRKALGRIRSARPTEPHLHAYLIQLTRNLPSDKQDALHVLAQRMQMIREHYQTYQERLAQSAVQHLPKGKRIATHCHSTSVISILKALQPRHVYASETRPRWQGRLTARDLAEAGIPVTLRVDSAMHLNVHDADMILVGSDAILPGGVVNKIGTRTLSILANLEGKPVIVVTDQYKFTREIIIEERDPREVWDQPPRGVRVENPAFDVTEHALIKGFLTPEGFFTPREALERFMPRE